MDEVRRADGSDPGASSEAFGALAGLKVAIVHDYLVNRGGAEKVTLALHRMFPTAPIYTALYHPDETFDEFRAADVRTTWLQRVSRSPTGFRRFLPLFGRAFRRLRLDGYDVVISSSAGFAHHVRPAGACHIVYCHTPPRFLWDEVYDRSVAPRWARPLVPAVLARLRRRDRRAAAGAHLYVSNSKVTANRIDSVYGRRSVVVHPPIEVERFGTGPTGDYYLMVGRLVPHRDFGLAIEAFNTLGRRLVVVGEGPAREALQRTAGPTIEFRGSIADDELAALYGGCRGVIVPGVEDFGLVPLEANASGRPVIARGAGGALETVTDGFNGVLFSERSAAALAEAVRRRERMRFEPEALRAHAAMYSERAFAQRLIQVIDGARRGCLGCARERRERTPVRIGVAEES